MDGNREKLIFRLLPLNLNLTRFSVTFALKFFRLVSQIAVTAHYDPDVVRLTEVDCVRLLAVLIDHVDNYDFGVEV